MSEQFETMDELFKAVRKKSRRQDRAELLQQNNSIGLRDVLKLNYDKTIDLGLPEGPPPYTPVDIDEGQKPTAKLFYETPKLRDLLPGAKKIRGQAEMSFIKILQSIHPNDANILILAKDKQLQSQYNGLSEKLVNEAFPGLLNLPSSK